MLELIDQTAIISQETTEIGAFMEALDPLLTAHLSHHVIVVLSDTETSETIALSYFEKWATAFKEGAKSFIVVTQAIGYEESPETLSVCPSLQEAKDLIEMEEIERDLGF